MKRVRYMSDFFIIMFVIANIILYYYNTFTLPKLTKDIKDVLEINAEITDYEYDRSAKGGIIYIDLFLKGYSKSFDIYDVNDFQRGIFEKEYEENTNSICHLIVTKNSLEEDYAVDVLEVSINGKECLSLETSLKYLKKNKKESLAFFVILTIVTIISIVLRIRFNKVLHEEDNEIYIYSR